MSAFDANNELVEVFEVGARTDTTSTIDYENFIWKGLTILMLVSEVSGTGGLQPRMEVKDPDGGYTFLNVPPPAITTIGNYLYTLYPGAGTGGGANLVQAISLPLPKFFRVTITHLDNSSYTYAMCILLQV